MVTAHVAPSLKWNETRPSDTVGAASINSQSDSKPFRCSCHNMSADELLDK